MGNLTWSHRVIVWCLQLTERRRGNEFYHQKNLTAAKYHYERARHIVDFIKGQDTATQNEIDANFVAISLNLAALSLASKEPSKAVKFCTEALRRQEKHPKALMRRAKAYLKMHEYQARRFQKFPIKLSNFQLINLPGMFVHVKSPWMLKQLFQGRSCRTSLRLQ